MLGKNKKFYITTSIAYTNAPPHLGFVLELVQADVLARYHRLLNEEVFFLTGTDEHGLKTKKAAELLGQFPENFADQISQKFRNLKPALNLSNDDFIRTTDQIRHRPTVEKIWKTLEKRGDLYKKQYDGLYCPGCESFKTQKEISDGKCLIHFQAVEKIREENYFFKLSKYLPKVKKIIEKEKIKIIPESKKNEILSMIESGMDDVSFSRAKEKYWGIPVPGDESQIIYVWLDALSNYISALGYEKNEEKFKKFWPADIHCIGKDIVKFHAILWPAILLSLDLPLPKLIFVHGFINVGGQKMSKSLGNVVDPFLLTQKYGTDSVRYYLLREIVSTEDGDFTYEKFEKRYNSDLSGGIGNLVARTVTLANRKEFKLRKPELFIKKAVKKTEKEYHNCIKKFAFHETLKSVWKLISVCDKHINENKPWENGKNAAQTISNVFYALDQISFFLNPFLPQTALKIEQVLKIKKSTTLFPKIEYK